MTKKKKDRYEKYWKYPGSRFKSDSQWFTFLRSNLRKGWNTHFMKFEKLKQVTIQIPNPNEASVKRFPTVKGAVCEVCGTVCALSSGSKAKKNVNKIVIDHIQPAGAFSEIEHVQKFFERMFCVTLDDLRAVCTDCNTTLALADKQKISFEEAKCVREAKAIVDAKQEKQWLLDRDILPASAQANRRKQVFEQLKKERGIETK